MLKVYKSYRYIFSYISVASLSIYSENCGYACFILN